MEESVEEPAPHTETRQSDLFTARIGLGWVTSPQQGINNASTHIMCGSVLAQAGLDRTPNRQNYPQTTNSMLQTTRPQHIQCTEPSPS